MTGSRRCAGGGGRTGDGVASGHGRRRARDERNDGSDGVADHGQQADDEMGATARQTATLVGGHGCDLKSRGYKAYSVPGTGTSFSGKETSYCVQDKGRETDRLYAIAAVRAKRTQQSLRVCPSECAKTRSQPKPACHGRAP